MPKKFLTFDPVDNAINFFGCNYAIISVTSININWKYTNNGVKYAKKVL
jgi:hypothetical protein